MDERERGASRATRRAAASPDERRETSPDELRHRQRRRLRTRVGAATALLLLAGGLTWAVVSERASGARLTGLITYDGITRGHVDGTVHYAQTPPAGGVHAEVWLNCGIYPDPVPNENAVHSLEHGALWITYRPDLPADQVATLRRAVTGQPYGLLSPYPGLPAPVVATVWGTQLRLQTADDPRLTTFITTYGDGTHAPEPRGECAGGTGAPQR